jgi:hypothetical protein
VRSRRAATGPLAGNPNPGQFMYGVPEMLDTDTPSRMAMTCEVESELMDLEGLAIALKLVRHGYDTFDGLDHAPQ